MDDRTPLVHLEGIRKSYGDVVRTEVLHGVDLEIRAGEFCALIGPSGSGKSTLLNILGLLDRPTSGTMTLDGNAAQSLGDDARSELRGRALGFVFQFHHLLPEFTAIENVAMPLIATRGFVEPEMLERARALLSAIGLDDRMNNRATDLSGGQQQRVAIARALVHEPLVVLADEPTGNLDTHTGDDVFELLRMFNQERGTAFLIVTHDSRIADRCDRVIELIDGRIVRDGPRR